MSEKNIQRKKAALIIMDGWGYTSDTEHNGIHAAHTPFFDYAWKTYPHTLLEASGLAVGLPEGQMGNSEIGHTTIGAGSAIDTDLVTIEKSIRTGTFFDNVAFAELVAHAQKYHSKIHMIGLLSDGGVHSHNTHVYAFLKLAAQKGLKKEQVVLHLFTDGRDTAPKTAARYLRELQAEMDSAEIGVIGSFGGRYFGMDRAGNHDRVAMVTDILFEGKGKAVNLHEMSLPDFMDKQYVEVDPTGKIDEYLEHFLCTHHNGKAGETEIKKYIVDEHDGIFFFNFRADRARQLTVKILERKADLDLCFVSMTQYGDEIDTIVAFPPAHIETSLSRELSASGISHAHISESEKFPHVTFFMNGQKDGLEEGEIHVKVDSRSDIATHDQAPEMKAKEIVDAGLEALKTHDFLVVNFPNADVVGHTGNIDAIIKAVETVDRECKRLVEGIIALGGVVVITADHGNAEVMIEKTTGDKHTAHTTNPVPCIVTEDGLTLRDGGTLADLAPTILQLFDIEETKKMKGKGLIV
ncbi:MAG: 2,3-bisphosphoglycerate-independent phosphoglycerate mutase [Patescibacteria group bacterium]